MSLNELKEDINKGHEIEFVYKGKEYAISHTKKGCHFNDVNNEGAEQIFGNVDDLVANLKIEGKYIEEILNDFKDVYIY